MSKILNSWGNEHATPLDVTIAFALALVKSKPTNLTVKGKIPELLVYIDNLLIEGDYILSLRNHIAVCYPGHSGDIPTASIDAVGYWREQDAQTRSQLECSQRTVYDQQLEIESLKMSLQSCDARHSDRKRKKQISDAVSEPSTKRARPEELQQHVPVVSSNLTVTYQSSSLKALLSSVFRLETILKDQEMFRLADTALYINEASEVVSQVFHEILARHREVKVNATQSCGGRGLREDLAAFSRALKTLMTCCKMTGRSSAGITAHGKTIYAIVQLFNQITQSIRNMSRDAVVGIEEQEKSQQTSVGVHTRSRARLPSKISPKDTVETVNVVNALVTLLGKLFDLLDPGIDVHRSIFEGFAYCVMSRLGDLLYAVIFNHERGLTLESEIEQSGVAKSDRTDEKFAPLGQVRLEAQCWVHLLKRLMSAAPGFLDPAANHSNPRAEVTSDHHRGKWMLADNALNRLQRTLVHSIFGVKDDGQGESLGDCLQMPVHEEIEVPAPQANDRDIGDWLKEEVWGILGWEILSRESFGQGV